MNDNWIDVKDELPKIDKGFGHSDDVLISVHDMDVPDEDASEGEWAIYVPFFTAVAHLVKLSTGCHVCEYRSGNLVEEYEDVVVGWQPMPEPKTDVEV